MAIETTTAEAAKIMMDAIRSGQDGRIFGVSTLEEAGLSDDRNIMVLCMRDGTWFQVTIVKIS